MYAKLSSSILLSLLSLTFFFTVSKSSFIPWLERLIIVSFSVLCNQQFFSLSFSVYKTHTRRYFLVIFFLPSPFLMFWRFIIAFCFYYRQQYLFMKYMQNSISSIFIALLFLTSIILVFRNNLLYWEHFYLFCFYLFYNVISSFYYYDYSVHAKLCLINYSLGHFSLFLPLVFHNKLSCREPDV